MNIDRQFSNDKPIYTQLVEQIKRLIVSGSLNSGDKLESVRDIALKAGVNPNTVQRAFGELERTGLVYTQRTNGRFITDDVELIEKMKSDFAQEEIRKFIRNMQEIGFDKDEILKQIDSYKEEE